MKNMNTAITKEKKGVKSVMDMFMRTAIMHMLFELNNKNLDND
jgi:hypothetical protein